MKTTTTIARLHAWKRALRDGGYEQGTGRLGRVADAYGPTPRYCCLGVACIVALGDEKAHATIDWTAGGVPQDVEDWFGVDIDNLELGLTEDDGVYADGETIIAEMANDDMDWDFNKIADAIEATARRMG